MHEAGHGIFRFVPGESIDAVNVRFAPKEPFQRVAGAPVEMGVGKAEPAGGTDPGAGQRIAAHHAAFAQKEGEGGTECLPKVHAPGEVEWALNETQVEFGFFAHHVAIPFGLEHKVDAHIFDAGYARSLDAHVFHDEVGSGTVGRGEGHVDVEQTVVGQVYIVDETEVVDVDGNLRVVDRFEHFDDLFFDLQFFFGSHRMS